MEQADEVSIDFQSDQFHYSSPSNKIYVAYLMYPAFPFRPNIFDQTTR